MCNEVLKALPLLKLSFSVFSWTYTRIFAHNIPPRIFVQCGMHTNNDIVMLFHRLCYDIFIAKQITDWSPTYHKTVRMSHSLRRLNLYKPLTRWCFADANGKAGIAVPMISNQSLQTLENVIPFMEPKKISPTTKYSEQVMMYNCLNISFNSR